MKEHPILFSGEMVRAILDGRKTQTRRVIRDQEYIQTMDRSFNYGPLIVRNSITPGIFRFDCRPGSGGSVGLHKCPYGFIDDRLWVRETFQIWQRWGSVDDEFIGDEVMELDGPLGKEPLSEYSMWNIAYKADDGDLCKWWRPSIFMPRWASRITLEIVNVRIERLHEITRDDAKAEGMSNIWKWDKERNAKHPEHFVRGILNPYAANYSVLWDEINAKRGFGWNVNPWVWVIEFKRVEVRDEA